jgi:hypothetical protein
MCRRNRTVSGLNARYVSIGLDDSSQNLLKLATAQLKERQTHLRVIENWKWFLSWVVKRLIVGKPLHRMLRVNLEAPFNEGPRIIVLSLEAFLHRPLRNHTQDTARMSHQLFLEFRFLPI